MTACARPAAGRRAFLALLLAGCGGGGAPARPVADAAPVEVEVVRVVAGTLPRTVRATGTFHPREVVTVAAKVAGRVAAVGAEVGDPVPPDAVLARIDETDVALVRGQRAAALAESLARLGLDALPQGDVDLEALPSVERARIEAAGARARRDRGRALKDRASPLISDQDLEDLETASAVAESALRAARLDVRAVLAQARTRAADLAAAEQQVRDAVHRAPPGAARWLVADRLVSTGDYAQIGRPLVRLLDPDPLRLRVGVPERRMAGVAPGRTVAVVAAGGGAPVEGRVARLRPEVDPATRTFEVEIDVPNPDLRLSAGSFAVAEISVGEDVGVPLVPASAVVTFAGVRKVFVPVDGKAEERRVSLGRRVGDAWEVEGGLAVGDAVIAAPPAGVVPGAALRVREGPPPGGPR